MKNRFIHWLKRRPVILAVLGVLLISAGPTIPAAASAASKHALLIDISTYSHLKSQSRGLNLTALRTVLFGQGYDVKLIENGSRREVVQAIHNLTYNINTNDTVFIALQAGVAMTDRSDDLYILFEDTRVDDIEVDGLTLGGLDIMLDRYGTPNQLLVLLLDTLGTKVYQAQKQSKSRYLEPIRDDVQTVISRQLALLGEERIVLSEIDSRDDKSDSSGSIASLLVSGMRGRADADRNGVVEAQELQVYIEQNSSHVPIVEGQVVSVPLESGMIVRTAPIDESEQNATASAPIATRSFKLAVLTEDMAAQHKKVLADLVVDGLLSRRDNLLLYGLMSHISGKSRQDIAPACYQTYRSLEPMLQDAYELQGGTKKSQLKSLVIADKMKQLLQKLPPACIGK